MKFPSKPTLLGASIACALLSLASPTQASSSLLDEDIKLQDSYVRPDYVEIERLRNTKEIIVIPKEEIQQKGKRTISDVLSSQTMENVNSTGMGNIDIR